MSRFKCDICGLQFHLYQAFLHKITKHSTSSAVSKIDNDDQLNVHEASHHYLFLQHQQQNQQTLVQVAAAQLHQHHQQRDNFSKYEFNTR